MEHDAARGQLRRLKLAEVVKPLLTTHLVHGGGHFLARDRRTRSLQVLHRHGQLHASEETHDMREAVHLVIEKIEKQARRALKKFQSDFATSVSSVATEGAACGFRWLPTTTKTTSQPL